MKKMIKKLIHRLPYELKNKLHDYFIFFKNKKHLKARKLYRFSDEKLKYTHLLECVNYLRIAGHDGKVPPVYFEFGCHSGRTFSSVINAANYLGLPNVEYYAFDSFQGLPETNKDMDGYFEAGTFATSLSRFKKIIKKNTGIKINDNQCVPGFYEESLTEELQKKLPKVGLVHIDVDLYSSTVVVLNFLKPLLSIGTLIVFDDWYCYPPGEEKGERLAFDEFRNSQVGFKFEEWKAYSTFGKSFFVTNIPDKK